MVDWFIGGGLVCNCGDGLSFQQHITRVVVASDSQVTLVVSIRQESPVYLRPTQFQQICYHSSILVSIKLLPARVPFLFHDLEAP